jgi:hypothetical protein
MLEFDLPGFTATMRDLGEVEASCRPREREQLDTTNKGFLLGRLEAAESFATRLGLDAAARESKQFIERLNRPNLGPPDLSEVAQRLERLRRNVENQLQGKLFMFIPADKARLYSGELLFGEAVERKFPSAAPDIAEAGKCFAAGRHTACVFHLMRVMERGVQAFAVKLRVPEKIIRLRDWGSILGALKRKIDAIAGKTVKTKSKKESYSEAWAFLDRAKDAWRNPTMHPKVTTYSEEEAKEVFDCTKAFMGRLAGIV